MIDSLKERIKVILWENSDPLDLPLIEHHLEADRLTRGEPVGFLDTFNVRQAVSEMADSGEVWYTTTDEVELNREKVIGPPSKVTLESLALRVRLARDAVASVVADADRWNGVDRPDGGRLIECDHYGELARVAELLDAMYTELSEDRTS